MSSASLDQGIKNFLDIDVTFGRRFEKKRGLIFIG